MEFGVGSVLEGKVTGITKFGAFVSLPEGKSGLVHISEIAYSYALRQGDERTELCDACDLSFQNRTNTKLHTDC